MQNLKVFSQPAAFPVLKPVGHVPAGSTVREIIAEAYDRGGIPKKYRSSAVVEINGDIVPPEMYDRVKPKVNASVIVNVSVHGGGGGKNPLATVLSLAVIVAAPYLGSALAPSLVGAVTGLPIAGGSIVTAVGGVLGGVIGAAGLFAVSMIFPTRPPSLPSLNRQNYSDSPTYSISGSQNELRPFQPVPSVLGVHKCVPALGAKPYTEIAGDDEYLRQLFVIGYGPVKIEDIKIGNTDIGDYDDVEIEIREGFEDDDPITLIPNQVTQENVSAALTQSGGWIQRTTPDDTDEISIDISFPQGLVRFTDSGGRANRNVNIEVQYRLQGSDTWIDRPDFDVTAKVVGTVRRNQRWTVDRGTYQVRLRRTTADTSSTQIVDDCSWGVLRSIQDDPPVVFPHPLAMIAVRIKASEQLSGVIDSLSCTASSYVEDWNGSEWVPNQVSNNPASLMRHVLMGPANARARTSAQVNDDDMSDFWEWCDTNGYKFNMIRDYQTSVWDCCADIASSARAAPTLADGKWSVIIDKPDKPVAQYFTPRNSWGFEATKEFPILPHAWRVRFVDEESDYEQDERIVYDDGYDETNATKFEGLEFAGVTNRDLIWKHGRYHIAQIRLRPEKYSFNAGLENLRCQRGDRIQVAHDVPMWGTGYPRIKSLVTSGGNTTGIVFDDNIIMEAGKSYVVKVRLEDGSSETYDLVTVEGQYTEVELDTPVATSEGPQVGDLCMFGELDSEVADLLVENVEAKNDIIAKITCVDYAPEIHNADSGTIPPFDPNITSVPSVADLLPPLPTIADIQSGTAALQVDATGNFRARIIVSVATGAGTPRTGYFVLRYREDGGEWNYIEGAEGQFRFAISDVTEGVDYDIQVKAVSIYGVDGNWTATQTETVLGQSEPPSNVTGLSVNVLDGTAYLSWDAVGDIDVKSYRIRWSPEKSGATWDSSVDVRVGVTTNSESLPAQVGTYLVKAVDYAGNQSPIAAAAITNISKIQGLNFVEAIEEGPAPWNGAFDDTRYDADRGGVTLDWRGDEITTRSGHIIQTRSGEDILAQTPDGGYIETGTYELPGYIDLQDTFTVRTSATINAEGYDIGSRIELATRDGQIIQTRSGEDLQGRDTADVPEGSWNITIQYAYTEDDPSGSPTWSDWADFVAGDLTTRAFKVRLAFTGSPPSITPVLTYIKVTLDMKDRVVGFEAEVGTSGATITFDPEFFVVPEIGISVSDGQEGDSYVITSRSEGSFDIAFTNGGTPVARSVSGVAKGYGERAA